MNKTPDRFEQEYHGKKTPLFLYSC
jgi:hypothetical protein